MKKIKGIILHCSASSWGSAFVIDKWHRELGFNKIGYHFVVLNGQINNSMHLDSLDGGIERGRSLSEKESAHAYGYNQTHIGICSISNGYYTEKQASSLFDLVVELQELYDIDIDNILGHNEVSPKSCPCFDVEMLRDAILYQDKEKFLEYMKTKDEEK